MIKRIKIKRNYIETQNKIIHYFLTYFHSILYPLIFIQLITMVDLKPNFYNYFQEYFILLMHQHFRSITMISIMNFKIKVFRRLIYYLYNLIYSKLWVKYFFLNNSFNRCTNLSGFIDSINFPKVFFIEIRHSNEIIFINLF
jgi:hypothetical protein